MDGLKTKATLKQETSQFQSVSVLFFSYHDHHDHLFISLCGPLPYV